MKIYSLGMLLVLFFISCAENEPGVTDVLHVETGLDVLVKNNFEALKGKKVGLITNHTGLTKDGKQNVDLLHLAENVNLTALFGPEHGVRGNQPGGVKINSVIDSITGVPIYSLYTESKKPTKEMLQDLDVLIFDIQDVGARFYTYIYTMALAMESAAVHNKQFIVLDRPNPIGGTKVEGPILKEGFESFVGMFKLPVRHGLTVAELAIMFKGEGWLSGSDSLDLKVVKMTGWQRSTWVDETDVPWVAPSPNMVSIQTAAVYPGICLFEGTNLSEGRGTDKPFEKVGAPWVNAEEFAEAMNSHNLPGVKFIPISFTPKASPAVHWLKFKDQLCNGLFIDVLDREAFEAVRTGVSIIWTLNQLYPDEFDWSATINRLYGSDILKSGVDSGQSMEYFLKDAEHDLESFNKIREKYLLYHE